ncbi:hypothetical protein BDF19DRAFT_456342 [Syncephalis fuscata]|nr:hypothetical protein BDF19DRAFT_456342 [Syncephalis fuscata]
MKPYNPKFDKHSSCSFVEDLSVISNNIRNLSIYNISASILVVDQLESKEAKCKTVGHTAHAIAEYSEWYNTNVAAPIQASLYLLRNNITGDPGGPYSVPYASNTIPLPPENRKIRISLLPLSGRNVLLEWLDVTDKLPILTVIQEAGPWNDLIFSTKYQIFIWTFAVFNVCFIFKALFDFAVTVLYGKVRLNIRTFLFTIAILYVICIIVHSMAEQRSFIRELAVLISKFSFNVAFYILLTVWSSIEAVIQMERRTNALKIISHVVFSMQAIIVVAIFILHFFESKYEMAYIEVAFKILMFLQSCIALIFLYYGIYFYDVREEYIINQDSFKSLTKLSNISAASFAVMLLELINQIIGRYTAMNYEVYSHFTRLVIDSLLSTVCSGILLYIVGIRMPSEEDSDAIRLSNIFKYFLQSLGLKHPSTYLKPSSVQ